MVATFLSPINDRVMPNTLLGIWQLSILESIFISSSIITNWDALSLSHSGSESDRLHRRSVIMDGLVHQKTESTSGLTQRRHCAVL